LFVAVEGCVGSGKTTVAKRLTDYRKSTLLLEKFEKNPFLRRFYEEPDQHVIETELAFVLIHYHQLKTISAQRTKQEVISDFFFGKDRLFADLNIANVSERQVFDTVFNFLSEKVVSPRILIHLTCSDSLLLKRIRMRKQVSEVKIDPEYFCKLNLLYDEFIRGLDIPTITVDMDKHDFVTDTSNIEWLSRQLDQEISRVSH
jgi:deoxyadenosine/deoxycytidine kinase